MKIAISMNDQLLQEADATARRMGLSRGRFFALAVGDFLQRQRQEQMLLQLDEAYANRGEPAEKSLLKGIKSKLGRTANSSVL
jgi:hypothetical protein